MAAKKLTDFERPASSSRRLSFWDLSQWFLICKILGITLVSWPHLKYRFFSYIYLQKVTMWAYFDKKLYCFYNGQTLRQKYFIKK